MSREESASTPPDQSLLPLPGSALEQDLTSILVDLSDPMVIMDRDWRLTFYNRSAARVSHFKPADLNGPTHWELFPDTLGTELEQKYRRVMSERVAEEHELAYARFGLTLELRIIPLESGIAVMYRDVTAQRQAEAARVAAAGRLERVLELTSDAVVVLDSDYRYTLLNRRARELLENKGELLGQVMWAAFPEIASSDSPFYRNYRLTMEQGVATDFVTFYPTPETGWCSVQARRFDGGIIIFFRDITEQRRAEEANRQRQAEAERQRAEIETVYRTAPVGLALFDPVEFRYLRLNDRQAEFFGLTPDQVVGQTLTEMAPIPGLREMFEQVARGEPIRDQLLEGELSTRPGEHRYWTVNYYPVFAADGSVQAISAVSQEITRQKQAEAALIQSEKLAAVGRLATSISHEINNPLEAVTNLLYLIRLHEDLPRSLQSFVETAQGELARVSQIVTQTLRFHRQSVKPTLVNAESLVGPVLDLYQGRLANSGIEVQATYRSRTQFRCFENDIRQVLNNLIANAIDAMRLGGRLLVRAHDTFDHREDRSFNTAEPRRGVRITIADTGHGMSPATRARIFEPFYTTKDLNGTGLGLWISTEIVERHHGRLTVRSCTGPGPQGTAFSLFLPLGEQ